MIRRLAIVLVPVLLALGAWLLLRQGDGEPVPGMSMEPPSPTAAALTALPPAPLAAEAATTAPAEATVVRSAAANNSDQPPLPADPKWIEVRVVDAGTKQPIAGAEVRWNDSSVYPKIQALPEAERQGFHSDPERIARHYGWVTRSDAHGIARITTDDNGASAHAYADGRYATGHFGGQQTAPPDGWQLALEPDRTLRAQVLDAAGQAAVGVRVAILMFGADGKAPPGSGWIQPALSTAPDGIAEFRHIQNWLRWGGGKKRQFDVASWRVALDLPGHEEPGVEFDEAAPPAVPIVLQMPATGRLAVRLLHDGQVLTDSVTFGVFRGDDQDHRKSNSAQQFRPDADGWARLPHVALGGELNVCGSAGTADVLGTTPAPTRPGQEVQFELRCDGFYALAGRLLGPDGALLANTRAEANIHTDVMSGGGHVKTDAQGRFVWVLTKGYQDTARMDRLVLTQKAVGSPPLQVVVPPRDLARGTNDLGDLKMTAGALIVAGKFVFDPADTKPRVPFEVEALSTRRQRSGAEAWDRVENLTPSQQPDGAFEVRGDVKPGRHRLTFYAQHHLPVEPLEFRVGADDLVIPITIGHGLAATCRPPANLPTHQLRGVLVPAGQVTADTKDSGSLDRLRRMRGDRYTARSFGNSDPVDLRWMALPAGTYTLEIRTAGVSAPLATIPDVVVPPTSGGDPRLVNIDVRDQIHVRKVKVVLEPKPTQRWSDQTLVFVMPQADSNDWEALPVRNDEAVIPAPAGPLDLLVVSRGFQPKRFTMTDAEATVALDPWPSVELVFTNLPPLPEGIALWVSGRSAVPTSGQSRSQRYHTEGSGGGLDGMLEPGGSSVTVRDGRARVQVGEGSYRLSAYLMAEQGGSPRPQMLRTITPREVLGGNPAPIEVQLSAEELKTALEELQKEPAKK